MHKYAFSLYPTFMSTGSKCNRLFAFTNALFEMDNPIEEELKEPNTVAQSLSLYLIRKTEI